MNLQHLKIVLKVLLQELYNENLENTNDKEVFEKLPDELLPYGIDPDSFRKGVNYYIIGKFDKNNLKKGTVNNLIYQGVKTIFLNTTQLERFHYLNDILQEFYNNLIQKLIELKKLQSIISLEEFNQFVEKVTPFVKINLLNYYIKTKDSEAAKSAVTEIFEVLSNPKFSREVCYQIIKNKLKDKDIRSYKFVDYVVISNKNNGLLGEYFKLRINLEENEKQVSHYFFIKCLLEDGDPFRLELSKTSFRKEEIFYFDIIWHLIDFGYSDIVDFAPKCYFSRQYHYMVFDDVSINNYLNVNSKVPLTYKQISQSFKQLAKFHSISIIFEDLFSKLLNKEIRINTYYKELIVECLADPAGSANILIDTGIQTGKYLIDRFSDICVNSNIEEFKQKSEVAFNSIYDATKSSQNRRNFFGHGDIWVNNLLYQTGTDLCIMIDYQFIRYCSPAFDVTIFLHVNTNKETRLMYSQKLLDEYYFNLKSIFDKNNITIDIILSKIDFLKSLENVKPSAISLSLCYMPFMFFPKDVFTDPIISKEFVGGNRAKFIENYWDQLPISRFRELVEDLYVIVNS